MKVGIVAFTKNKNPKTHYIAEDGKSFLCKAKLTIVTTGRMTIDGEQIPTRVVKTSQPTIQEDLGAVSCKKCLRIEAGSKSPKVKKKRASRSKAPSQPSPEPQ